MALTEQDKAFLQAKTSGGMTYDEAWAKLSEIKQKKGITGGSFMTRAASVAENSGASPEVQQKATDVRSNFAGINANIGEQSKINEMKPSLGESALDVVVPKPVQNIAGAAYEGAKTLGTGLLEQAKETIGKDENKQVVGEGAHEAFQGAMQILGSPMTGLLKDVPGGEYVTKGLSYVFNSPAMLGGYLYEKGLEAAGQDPSKPEFQTAKSQIEDVLNLGTLMLGPKAVKAGGETINWGGKQLKGAGKTLTEKVLPTTTREAEMLQKFEAGVSKDRPRTVGETAVERGISGTQTGIGTKATATKSKIFTEEVNPALEASKEVITKEELFKPLEEKIAETLEPGRKAELQSALDAIKEEYADPRFDTLTLKDAQTIKSGLDEFTPQKSFKGQEISNAYNQLRADMANNIRQQTYNKLADINIKAKYLDYANLLELEKLGIKARTQKGVAMKPGGFATQVRDLWDMAAIPLGTTAGKWLYKAGDFLEFESPKPVKTVGEYIEEQGITKPEYQSVIKDSSSTTSVK